MEPNNNGFTALEITLIVAILAVAGFAGWSWWQANYNDASETSTQQTSTNQKTTEVQTANTPEGFVRYKNSELGFSFAYPEGWGKASLDISEVDDGVEKGKSFTIEFSKQPDMTVWGLSDGYQYSRDGYPTFTKGFRVKNGKVISNFADAQVANAKTFTTTSGLTGAYLNNKSAAEGRDFAALYLGGFNLKPEINQFSGVSFSYLNENEEAANVMTLKEFVEVLETFELL